MAVAVSLYEEWEVRFFFSFLRIECNFNFSLSSEIKKWVWTNLPRLGFILISHLESSSSTASCPKRQVWGKKRRRKLNYEGVNVPPEVTAHGGNSSLSFQHQHLSSRSRSFLWLNIKRRHWCQGESNQWSVFGLQQHQQPLCSQTDLQSVLEETFNHEVLSLRVCLNLLSKKTNCNRVKDDIFPKPTIISFTVVILETRCTVIYLAALHPQCIVNVINWSKLLLIITWSHSVCIHVLGCTAGIIMIMIIRISRRVLLWKYNPKLIDFQ